MTTSLEPWQEWVERCALSLCSPETAAVLQRFAARRFHTYLARCLGHQFSEAAVPDDRACFHLLETHCCVRSHRSGKRYKEWISSRSDVVNAALFESGASLLLRDVVRTFARRECSAPQQISVDAVIAGTDGLTLADLLPAPRRRPDLGDSGWAETVARACLTTLSDNHRLVVLARHGDVPLSRPSLLALLGVGKSRAAELWAEVYRRVAAETRSQVPAGDRESWLHIAVEASERLGELVFLRERVEKQWMAYFKRWRNLYG